MLVAVGFQNLGFGWCFVVGAPVRTGWASPLRVATGGNASHDSKGRRRRLPACADVTARLGCGPIQYHGGTATPPHQIGQRKGNQGIAIREFCSDTRLVGLLGMAAPPSVYTVLVRRVRPVRAERSSLSLMTGSSFCLIFSRRKTRPRSSRRILSSHLMK